MRPSLCLALAVAVTSASQGSSFVSHHASQCRRSSSQSSGAWLSEASRGKRQANPTGLGMAENSSNQESETDADNIVNIPSGGGGPERKTWVALTGLTGLAALCLAAKVGVLPGIPLADGTFSPYTDGMIARDAGSSILTFGLAYGFVKIMTNFARNGILEAKDTRKIIHTFTGPLFVVAWPIFSEATGARSFAGIVPLVNAIRLVLASTGEGESTKDVLDMLLCALMLTRSYLNVINQTKRISLMPYHGAAMLKKPSVARFYTLLPSRQQHYCSGVQASLGLFLCPQWQQETGYVIGI